MAAASFSLCLISPTRCQARTRLYRDGRLELEGFPVADISDHLSDGSVTIWLDLRDPHQTQGLAVRPKIARLGSSPRSTGRAGAEPGTYRHRHFFCWVRWSMSRLCSSVVSRWISRVSSVLVLSSSSCSLKS
jgi:hypothetical protein